jgi:hypothetical protein
MSFPENDASFSVLVKRAAVERDCVCFLGGGKVGAMVGCLLLPQIVYNDLTTGEAEASAALRSFFQQDNMNLRNVSTLRAQTTRPGRIFGERLIELALRHVLTSWFLGNYPFLHYTIVPK